MARRFSHLIVWGCLLVLLVAPAAALFLLIDIEAFAGLARRNLHLPIQWQSVSALQWYGLWVITALYVAVGLGGLYFLRRAFVGFARGEWFTPQNSRHLRRFAIFLFVQALAKPLHFALASVLLSWNHPEGQKMLSLSVGSGELKMVALAMILWVLSDLLVKASQLDAENKQFV